VGLCASGLYDCKPNSCVGGALAFKTGVEKSINGVSSSDTVSGILGRLASITSRLPARLDDGFVVFDLLGSYVPLYFLDCQASAAARLASIAGWFALDPVVLSDEETLANGGPEGRKVNGMGFFSFFSGDGVLDIFGCSALSLVAPLH
jgi:hypothetical protein